MEHIHASVEIRWLSHWSALHIVFRQSQTGLLTCTPRHLRSGQVYARCKCRREMREKIS